MAELRVASSRKVQGQTNIVVSVVAAAITGIGQKTPRCNVYGGTYDKRRQKLMLTSRHQLAIII